MSRRLSDCSCTWRTVAEMPVRVPVMSVREPSCPQHGDDTDWWLSVQAHARSLSTSVTVTSGDAGASSVPTTEVGHA